jgi:hypothetical protein
MPSRPRKGNIVALTFFLIISIITGFAILSCANPKDKKAATLDEYISDLNLYIGRDTSREDMTATFALEPKEKAKPPCPVFDIKAVVNDKPVAVSKSGYEADDSGLESCVYPRFTYTGPEKEILSTNFFLGESSPLWREVLRRLDIRISDASGDYSATFERELPSEVEMTVVEPTDGRLHIGKKVEVQFNPVPEETQDVTIVYEPENGQPSTIAWEDGGNSGGDSAASTVVFTVPSISPGTGTLRVGIIPWNRFAVACDFNACIHDSLELFYQNTPLYISKKVDVLP